MGDLDCLNEEPIKSEQIGNFKGKMIHRSKTGRFRGGLIEAVTGAEKPKTGAPNIINSSRYSYLDKKT